MATKYSQWELRAHHAEYRLDIVFLDSDSAPGLAELKMEKHPTLLLPRLALRWWLVAPDALKKTGAIPAAAANESAEANREESRPPLGTRP